MQSGVTGVANTWQRLYRKPILKVGWMSCRLNIFFSCALGNKCRTGQSLQQQTEETVEAVEICRMLRKEGKLIRMRWGSKTNESNTVLNGVVRCLGVCTGISYPLVQF